MKIVKEIQLKIIIFTAMKNRCMLHWRVFVMFESTYPGYCSSCMDLFIELLNLKLKNGFEGPGELKITGRISATNQV